MLRCVTHLNCGSVDGDIVWDACKAFLRGKLIAFKAYKDKINNLRRNNLLLNIRDLERDLKQNPQQEKIEQLQIVYDELKLLDAHKIMQEVLYGKQQTII